MNEPKKPKRCPQCGSRNIQLEDYDDDFVYIYCEECDESFEIPVGRRQNNSRGNYYQEEHR